MSSTDQNRQSTAFGALLIGAIGIVYGDIGTSPLYAIRTCLQFGHASTTLSIPFVMGVLSLVFWMLVLVVVVKYLSLVMSADNEGEGGILALLAKINGLVRPTAPKRQQCLIWLGLFGTALIVADGMITPSISVLSAVEGLKVAAPSLEHWVLPISIAVIIGLFVAQRHGTARIGRLFGPVMIVWFATLAALGLHWIRLEPTVLKALNPWYALQFFQTHGTGGLIVLGGVVLCVTGCEALYADMGHFGRKPIVWAWYLVVFPSILLNYFGQGAYLIAQGKLGLTNLEGTNLFFDMAPDWSLYPLVALATVATVIASQALITGMFSLCQQAIQLEYFPRTEIIHTSRAVAGQVYIPLVNAGLGIACVLLIIGFRTSDAMAAAYGIAVVGAMMVTTLLMFDVERTFWGWGRLGAVLVTGFFLAVDGFLMAGNVSKILQGGWFPLLVGVVCLIMFLTWNRGVRIIRKHYLSGLPYIEKISDQSSIRNATRVPGASVFFMSEPDIMPRSLLHHLKHYKILHEHVILICVIVERVPFVPEARQIKVLRMNGGFVRVNVYCGFMQAPQIEPILSTLRAEGIPLGMDVSYCLGHMRIKVSGHTQFPKWQATLFSLLYRVEARYGWVTGIPPNQVVELGEQIQL